MASRVTSCPNCGGTVEFKAGRSLLAVCPYCDSAVARIGEDVGELEILGKVAPLVALSSPLSLGVNGRWRGRSFSLIGQVQYDYGAGPWNEWYLVFDDGGWGWLAEAQGRVYLTESASAERLPSWDDVHVGLRLAAQAGRPELTVVEKRVARFIAATGETPFRLAPLSETHYCDVQGGDGVFGTIDFPAGEANGAAEAVFLGEEVRYQSLFDRSVLGARPPGTSAAAQALNCPNCGASVQLQAPDASQRVTCGTCGSLLDASRGRDLFLLSSDMPRIPEPLLPLGGQGKLDGVRWTVYGQLVKSVDVWGETFRWTEYLLYQRQGGFRWLVESDGHWSFVEPVDAGSVMAGSPDVLWVEGKRFERFSAGAARVEGLQGEFYWKVAVGDRTSATDYIHPPMFISEERALAEVSYSRGKYLSPKDVESAFDLQGELPKPWGIAPHQPNPRAKDLRRMLRAAVVLTAALAVSVGLRALTARESVLANVELPFRSSVRSAPGAAVSPTTGRRGLAPMKGEALPVVRFDVDGVANMAVHASADIGNGVLFLEATMVETVRGQARSLGLRLEHYGGYSGGRSWDRGSRRRVVYLGEVSAGEYELRIVPEWVGPTDRRPSRIRVRVIHDVFLGMHALVFGGLLWVLPVVGAIMYFIFEKRRWAESDTRE